MSRQDPAGRDECNHRTDGAADHQTTEHQEEIDPGTVHTAGAEEPGENVSCEAADCGADTATDQRGEGEEDDGTSTHQRPRTASRPTVTPANPGTARTAAKTPGRNDTRSVES